MDRWHVPLGICKIERKAGRRIGLFTKSERAREWLFFYFCGFVSDNCGHITFRSQDVLWWWPYSPSPTAFQHSLKFGCPILFRGIKIKLSKLTTRTWREHLKSCQQRSGEHIGESKKFWEILPGDLFPLMANREVLVLIQMQFPDLPTQPYS